jgi:hypothetical protein
VRADPDENVGEVIDRIDADVAARLDEREDRCRGVAAAHAAGEQPVPAADRDWSDGALAGVVVDRERPSSRKQRIARSRCAGSQ